MCKSPRALRLTLAFSITVPLVVMMEAGLDFRADAELTGEADSPLLDGWDDEDDGDGDDNVVDIWETGTAAALSWG